MLINDFVRNWDRVSCSCYIRGNCWCLDIADTRLAGAFDTCVIQTCSQTSVVELTVRAPASEAERRVHGPHAWVITHHTWVFTHHTITPYAALLEALSLWAPKEDAELITALGLDLPDHGRGFFASTVNS